MPMTEGRYLDLMHREIDGENSPEETAILREYLSTDPAARRLYEDLQQLAGDLSHMEVVDPPANLGKLVLSSIHAEQRNARRSRLRAEQWPRRLSLLKYAYAVAAGLILGALLTPALEKIWRGGRSDIYQLLGTMTRQDAFRDSIVVGGKIEAAGVSGGIQLRRSAALLLIEIEVASERPVEVLLQYDATQLRFKALETLDGETSSFQTSQDRLSWTQLGRNRSRILMTCLTRETRPMRVQVLASGRLLYNGLFPLSDSTEVQR